MLKQLQQPAWMFISEKLIKMDVNNEINLIMESFSNAQIKNLIKEFNQLKDTGSLPPDSTYRKLSETICEMYSINFNLKMGESWLQNEIFKRYLLIV